MVICCSFLTQEAQALNSTSGPLPGCIPEQDTGIVTSVCLKMTEKFKTDIGRAVALVEHHTLNQEVLGPHPTGVLCCVLEQDTLTPHKTG